MKFDFGEVLRRTWKIGWNHKVLWLWQMLPALATVVFVPLFFISSPLFMMSAPEPFNKMASEPWISIVFSLAIFLSIIPSMFLVVVIQLTTTYGAVKVEKGAEKLTFRGLFSESLPYFWRVLGLYAIFGGAWMLIWLGLMAFFMFSVMLTFGLGFICIIPIFLLLIPVLVVGYSVLELAQAAIVADDMRTMDAIAHGWELFRANWLGVTLLMVVLYFVMYILSGVFAFPMMFPMMMFPLGMDSPGDISTVMFVLFLIAFAVMFMLVYVVQGILLTFFQSAWAVTYMRLSHNANTPIALEEKPQEAGI